MSTEQRIVKYLKDKGRMSGRDICTDVGVTEVDVTQAENDGWISRATPPCGASSFPWYRVATAGLPPLA